MRSAAWFANSSISLHGCRSHYGRQGTNKVQHCFSNVSRGHANVQHVVVGGVLTVSRAHVWRIVFCLPHHGTDRMVCSHATAPQHTEQPVGDVHAFLLGYQSADVRAWFTPESNSQLSVIAQGRVPRHPRPRMLSSSVSPCHIHNETVFPK